MPGYATSKANPIFTDIKNIINPFRSLDSQRKITGYCNIKNDTFIYKYAGILDFKLMMSILFLQNLISSPNYYSFFPYDEMGVNPPYIIA